MINRAIAMYSINEYSEILNDIMTKNNNNFNKVNLRKFHWMSIMKIYLTP